MKPIKPRWRLAGPCCICREPLTDERHSRYCCSKECGDKAEADMKASIERTRKKRAKRSPVPQPDPDADTYVGGSAHQALERAETTDEEPLGQPTIGGAK